MGKQLFDWDGWDQQDIAAFSFYEVVLKTKIGDFEPGDKFDHAYVDYEKGILQLCRGEKHHWDYKIGLVVLGPTD